MGGGGGGKHETRKKIINLSLDIYSNTSGYNWTQIRLAFSDLTLSQNLETIWLSSFCSVKNNSFTNANSFNSKLYIWAFSPLKPT